MLGKLLSRYLARYLPLLITIVELQFASVMASLNLPEINADIINNGVAKADIGYIWNRGGFMLLVSLGQILASILATLFAARMAMSAGRDIRADVFERVSGFSEREVSQFGAGSLITRNTNDVQQVQMLAMMGATMFVTAPLLAIGGIIKAIQTDVGLSWLIAVSVPLLLVIAVVIIGRM
ncbi:ABC transporter transmembrane domain-containing protein, partial [Clavibacter michiganensis]|uniref:ABC transporter transmembrane domain-containing protein n=1 Tax=Clavibacter michiganensis TaxID=28447 RepID=UPI002930EE15